MCLICVEYQKSKMTSQEFKNALQELIIFSGPEELAHYEQLKYLHESGNENDLLKYTKEHSVATSKLIRNLR